MARIHGAPDVLRFTSDFTSSFFLLLSALCLSLSHGGVSTPQVRPVGERHLNLTASRHTTKNPSQGRIAYPWFSAFQSFSFLEKLVKQALQEVRK